MKKRMIGKAAAVFAVIFTIAVAMMLGGCTHKFKCGLCGNEVNEMGHKVSVLGQETEICDKCDEIRKAAQSSIIF